MSVGLFLALCGAGSGASDSPQIGFSTVSARAEASGRSETGASETPVVPSGEDAPSDDILSVMRQVMADAGLSLGVLWISELGANLQGGLRQRAGLLHYGDVTFGLDLDELIGWSGAQLRLRAFGAFGDSFKERIGDLQFTSNIELGDTVRLHEAWLEQCLVEGVLCLLLGIYELGTDFQRLDASSVFMHASHFIGAALYWSGLNGPSSIPGTVLGARLRIDATDALYFLGAVTDGVPGAVGEPSKVGYALRAEEGLHAVFEAGFRPEGPDDAPPFGKYALGVWRYTTRLPVLGSENERTRRGAHGAYALLEQRLAARPDRGEGLWLWARLGLADEATNLVGRFVGAGLTYRGGSGGREAAAGLAVAAAFASSGLRAARAQASENAAPSEIAVEATYRAGLTDWLALQFSLHWVHHPNFVRTVADAVTLTGRIELAL